MSRGASVGRARRAPRTPRAVTVLLAALLCALGTASAAHAVRPASAPASAPASLPGSTAGTVRGLLDGHTHIEGADDMGGRMICGEPFDPDGIAAALHDCADHYPNGELAVFENFLKNGTPLGTHDPIGWPTFRDWPAHDSLTHQQVYYTWLERAWKGGLRIIVDQYVANRVLCELYPLKKNPCDEDATIDLEHGKAVRMQDYIDSLNGGPGKGWFRIVRTPEEARTVAASGKLAVVEGIETSEPFGCREIRDVPQCTEKQIDAGLDHMQAQGVSTMFVCHKFDNALCGVRMDGGTGGVAVNLGNLVGTGHFWDVRTCTGPAHDNTVTPQVTLPAAVTSALGLPNLPAPLYPAAPHCNTRGLTALGAYMVKQMIKRKMIIQIDHMSVKAADQTLTLLEQAHYPGVISSHSWTDPGFYERIYRLGGMITEYGSPADQFAGGWRTAKQAFQQAGGQGLFGFGYGLDANGFGKLPAPRAGGDVQYPFTALSGVTLDRLRTGLRTWDVNADGVANYGLVPDWIEDIRKTDGPELTGDLANGAEAYLRMWERTAAYTPPSTP
ncbi:Coagulation factor 5/8 type domain-containing protein [Actinomadura logoneensis]|uniref:Coagulation factor 5/8 type domain-containing protein n=1 Tax=Actinomadura logoneensis TaxID=2293572 RepID=A0A372JA40_9ACTN|nr:Coagulation factor 5/8 type domain-containing protein [Actinomadura logoneensis]RFU36863.1 Coagulation factor 5/8 type domain-containing protein [Actinomadura logoneensis]